MTTRSSLKQPHTVDYTKLEPLPDPPREPDMNQRITNSAFDGTLIPHFADRDDVLVFGRGVPPARSDQRCRKTRSRLRGGLRGRPKAIVARNGYVISEVGKPPDFVLEVASRSTGRRDYTEKRDGYAGYGVREYWRFDHTGGRFHDAALAGDVLEDGQYEPVEIVHEPDGLIWGHSEVLGLDLCWDEGELRFRDPSTGEFLLTPEEQQSARIEAETRVAALEAELRQLRGQ